MAVVVAAFIAATLGGVGAGQVNTPSVAVDGDDIGGVVTGPEGPEAGAWVIAETTNLPTRLIKSVVTDDQGRYLIPDLPKATFDVWVRGYGLVDSQKVKATPGKALALDGGDLHRAREWRPSITRRNTGCRCCRSLRPVTSRALDRRATASRPT